MSLVEPAQLADFLRKAGLQADASDPQLASFCSLAETEWERLTGWSPFLATDAEAAIVIDVEPGVPLASLQTGFLSVSGVAEVCADGTVGSDWPAGAWQAWPSTALGLGSAYTHIKSELLRRCSRIEVTGVLGRMSASDSALPAVRAAVLMGAASQAYLYASQKPGVLNKVKQGSVELGFGAEPESSAIAQWRAAFERAALSYRRLVA